MRKKINKLFKFQAASLQNSNTCMNIKIILVISTKDIKTRLR